MSTTSFECVSHTERLPEEAAPRFTLREGGCCSTAGGLPHLGSASRSEDALGHGQKADTALEDQQASLLRITLLTNSQRTKVDASCLPTCPHSRPRGSADRRWA